VVVFDLYSAWFNVYIYLELLYHVPLCLWIIPALLRGTYFPSPSFKPSPYKPPSPRPAIPNHSEILLTMLKTDR